MSADSLIMRVLLLNYALQNQAKALFQFCVIGAFHQKSQPYRKFMNHEWNKQFTSPKSTHIGKNPLDNIHHNLYSLASKLMEIGYWFGLSFEQDKLFLLHYPQWQHLLPTAANHKHHFLLLFPRQAVVEAKAQCVELKFSWRL